MDLTNFLESLLTSSVSIGIPEELNALYKSSIFDLTNLPIKIFVEIMIMKNKKNKLKIKKIKLLEFSKKTLLVNRIIKQNNIAIIEVIIKENKIETLFIKI